MAINDANTAHSESIKSPDLTRKELESFLQLWTWMTENLETYRKSNGELDLEEMFRNDPVGDQVSNKTLTYALRLLNPSSDTEAV